MRDASLAMMMAPASWVFEVTATSEPAGGAFSSRAPSVAMMAAPAADGTLASKFASSANADSKLCPAVRQAPLPFSAASHQTEQSTFARQALASNGGGHLLGNLQMKCKVGATNA